MKKGSEEPLIASERLVQGTSPLLETRRSVVLGGRGGKPAGVPGD